MSGAKNPDIVYCVKRTSNLQEIFEVAKFDGGEIPVETYDVDLNGKPNCNCLGFTMHPKSRANPETHKHIAMVLKHKDLNEPWGACYWIVNNIVEYRVQPTPTSQY